jgi:hypothetical protein
MSTTQVVTQAVESRGVVAYATLIDGQWHASVGSNGAASPVEGEAEQIGRAVRAAVRRAAELNRIGG